MKKYTMTALFLTPWYDYLLESFSQGCNLSTVYAQPHGWNSNPLNFEPQPDQMSHRGGIIIVAEH